MGSSLKGVVPMASPFLVSDIRTGASGSSPQHLTAFNDGIAFSAEDTYANQEPWFSDGTSNGTFKLSEINPGGASSPANFTPVDNQIFFVADDGSGAGNCGSGPKTQTPQLLLKTFRLVPVR